MALYDDRDKGKRHRTDVMDDFLASIGLKRKPTPKDGSSLFRSVSEQLFSTQACHMKVRESCIAYMRRHQEDFKYFVEGSFEEYLEKMHNPKEWGDQLEISALSELYKCDFFIYQHPGQTARNATENNYEKKIYLWHSGQKHYDSVYPIQYFAAYGICQSIISSVLLTKVLGKGKDEEKKLVQTYRMLSCSEKEGHHEKKHRNRTEFPFSSVYKPSIGTVEKNLAIEMQRGLAYKLPYSLDFVRSLDSSVCRNIDYDFWITIKRRYQYIDASIAEGLQYCIGDRCLIYLNIYSKPLVGHVQEASPNNGPITVFIEALGEMHTVAVKNAKPLDFCNNGSRSDWRWGEHSRDDFWHSKYRDGTKFSGKNLLKNIMTSVRKYNNSMDKNQNLKKNSSFIASGSSVKKSRRSPHRGDCNRKQNWDDNKMRSKSNGKLSSFQKYKWEKRNADASPTRKMQELSINEDSFPEEAWPSTGECSEVGFGNPPFPGLDSNEDMGSSFGAPLNGEYSQPVQIPLSNGNSSEMQYWREEMSRCSRYGMKYSSEDEGGQENADNSEKKVEMVAYVVNPNQNQVGSSSDESLEGEASCVQQDMSVEYPCETAASAMLPLSQNVEAHGFYPHLGPSYAAGPALPMPQQSGARASYSGAVTVLDCDGKEMVLVDDKNPFQYFYNLGLEYFRQLSMGNPRPPPVVYGPNVSPTVFGSPQPVVHPQPVSYYPPAPNPQYVASHVPQPGACLPSHFHPVISQTSGGSMHFPVPPGRFIVHIPPVLPQNQPLQPNPLVDQGKIGESCTSDETILRRSIPNHDEANQSAIVTQPMTSSSFIPVVPPTLQSAVPQFYAAPPIVGEPVGPQMCPILAPGQHNSFMA